MKVSRTEVSDVQMPTGICFHLYVVSNCFGSYANLYVFPETMEKIIGKQNL